MICYASIILLCHAMPLLLYDLRCDDARYATLRYCLRYVYARRALIASYDAAVIAAAIRQHMIAGERVATCLHGAAPSAAMMPPMPCCHAMRLRRCFIFRCQSTRRRTRIAARHADLRRYFSCRRFHVIDTPMPRRH